VSHDVVVVGAGFAGSRMAIKLKKARLYDFVVLAKAVSYAFSDTTDHWTVETASGERFTARIVIAAREPDIPGLSIRDAYLGVAVAELPNFFLLGGSDIVTTEAQVRYLMRLLRMMGREDAKRIEVKSHVQKRYTSVSLWRRMRRPNIRHYSLTPFEGVEDETFRSPAVVTADEREIPVEVHLMGHLQPIDGSYQWFGRIAKNPDITELHRTGRNDVTVQLPGRDAARARLTEVDPWGNVRVTGTGTPPFPTD
jgi:hypothetical protein